VSEAPGLDLLIPALRDTCLWFEDRKVPAVLIGGVASGILGRPRFTRDIDFVALADPERWPDLLAAAGRFELVPRRPDALSFATKHRILLLRHAPSGVDLDVSLGVLPFERETLDRSRRFDIGGVSVTLPTPEDLIILKAVANRPIDWADAEAVAAAHPDLDVERVRRWTAQFAEALEAPEILTALERVLARRPR
jgi:hypothetical protein